MKHILLDLNIKKLYVKPLDMWIHSGFYSASLELYRQIIGDFDKNIPISIVGHSLGAAISCIVASMLKINGFTIEKVTCFGSPSFTDIRGAKKVDELVPNITRISMYMDIVRLMPGSTVS